MQKVPDPAAHLPDAFVRLLPVFTQPVELLAGMLPTFVGQTTVTRIDKEHIHEFSIDIELALASRCIADAHGAALSIAFQVIQPDLGHLRMALNGIDRLQFSSFLEPVETSFEPANKCLRLVGKTQGQQAIQREGSVTKPGKAVIPISYSSYRFGKAGGGSCHNSSRRSIGKKLQGQGGTVYIFAPAPLVMTLAEPAPPVAPGFRKLTLVHFLRNRVRQQICIR